MDVTNSTGTKYLNREKGRAGESAALEYLRGEKYEILETNYAHKSNLKGGEIDIIARKGDVYHFVEVKARTTDRFGYGREAVTRAKQTIIHRIATLYLTTHRLYGAVGLSFDIAEITGGVLDFYENCF
jgi:putative endonuclease